MNTLKTTEITENPNNPRTITETKFNELVASIKSFPEMLEARPIVVDPNHVILGGNQRFKAAKAAGLKKVPVYVASWSEVKSQEFVIKDNVSFGNWDWDLLANEWDVEQLQDWGMHIGGFDVSPDEFDDSFDLPDGDKSPFQQITFTMADEQHTIVKNAIADIKKTEEYKYVETFGNENSNGNALYLIISQWAEQRT